MGRCLIAFVLTCLTPLALFADLIVPDEGGKDPNILSRTSPEQDLAVAIAGLVLATGFALGGLWLIWRKTRRPKHLAPVTVDSGV